ncbi:hypothetical protein PF002_g4408 [Phytophthora fragariae]|uniref:Hexosyltransferase n=1 Tax=Phytophthora fragariae TaxID=53985 RepID=A0A6A4A7J3_9STRA|nr:hypothetical protein PF002_g4408 [Phytophthora fragariae]
MFVYLRFLVFIAAASVVVHAAFLQDAPEAEDPILKFQINHPQNGSVVTLPLKVSCRMSVKSIELYSTHYAGMLACIEIQDAETKCNPVLDSDIVFHELPEGQHTVRAYIANRSEGGARRHLTETVTFSIVSATEFEEYTEDLVRRSRENLKLPRDLDILEWAQQQHVQGQGARHDLDAALSSGDVDVPRLVIGIKTAVLSNFPRRQAIRETWGKQTTLSRVKVIFLGCSPSMVDVDDERHQQLFREAVALEKVVYGDFLTGELNCEDSYRLLTEKVKAFYQFAATTFPQTPYVMIADDDVYLRVEKLVSLLDGLGSTRRIYLGQAWNSVFSRTPTPVRDEFHKNYLPREQYPMRELLPYAFGAHYVISMDCARFISKNSWRLRGLNGLEDLSVGLWLLTMQVPLKHTQAFSHLTIQSCRNNLISFAELSPLGIRAIHANLLRGNEFCDGFDRTTWNQYKAPSPREMLSAALV